MEQKQLTHFFKCQKKVNEFPNEMLEDIREICKEFFPLLTIEKLGSDEIKIKCKIDDQHSEDLHLLTKISIPNIIHADLPFDTALCMILLVIKHYLGRNFKIFSDNFIDEDDEQDSTQMGMYGNWRAALLKLWQMGFNMDAQIVFCG